MLKYTFLQENTLIISPYAAVDLKNDDLYGLEMPYNVFSQQRIISNFSANNKS
jgi:hypothetical protein